MVRRASILVALYKAGEFLHAKLESLRRLVNFTDCEIIFLNCQNLDNESSIYQSFLEFSNVREIYYNTHINLYPTWNDGIQTSSSEFILNSNVDDMMHPNYIHESCEYLDINKEVSILSSGVLVTNIPNQIWPNWIHNSRMPMLTYPFSTAGPCPIWRRNLHDRYGYFQNYRSIGDARMWERWYANGEKFGLIESDLVLYYFNPNSLERRRENGVSLRDLDLKDNL